MAGGEKAKSSGEYGEQIVKNILDMMGWNNANSGVTVHAYIKKNIKGKILKSLKSMELIMSIHINLN